MVSQFVEQGKTKLVECDTKFHGFKITLQREVWNNPDSELAGKTRQYVCFFRNGEDEFTLTCPYLLGLLRKLGRLLVAYTEEEAS